MVQENKFGQILDYIKDNGKMINQMEKEDLSIQMEMFMKDIGKMEKLTAEEK